MAGNVFNFGIGITASDEGATQAIGSVISQIGNLDDRMEGLSELKLGSETAVRDADLLAMEVCGVVVCAENADIAIQSAAASTGDWSEKMGEIPKKAMTVSEHFSRVGDAASTLENSGSQLRHQMTRLYRRMGDTALAADMMTSSVLKSANANKVSWEQVAALQGRLAGAAISMGDLKGSAEENMNTMVQLSETFGLSEDQVRDLAGTMKMTGNSLTDLAGTAVQFEKDFRVPGIINTLPDALETAVEAQANFGSVVGKSSKDITTNIMRMTGTYSRALGITAAEAANKARGTFMKFTGEIESFEDVFLGLADDFTPLQTAFLETGMSMEDMEDLMRKGAEAPGEFAEEVKRIRDSMDPQMGQRFFRQVLRNSDEATKRLLTQENAAKEANAATAGAGAEPEDPSGTFNKIADAMRENAVDAQRMHVALKGVTVELAKVAADEGVRKGLMVVNKVIQGLNTTLITQYDRVRQNKEEFDAYNKVICGATAALVGMNDAAGAFNKIVGVGSKVLLGIGSAAALLFKPFTFLISKLKAWRAATAGAGGAGARAGGIFKGFAKIIGKLALPIAIVIAAFDNVVKAVTNIGAILGDPNKTGMQKFKGIVKEVLGAVIGTIDDFFFGLPGKFIEGFKKMGQGVSNEGAKDFGKAIGTFLGKGLTTIIDWFSTSLVPWFKDTLIPGIKKTFSAMGTADFWIDLGLSILGGFAAIGDQILGFMGGMAEGVLNAFGIPMEALGPVMEIVWLKIEKFLVGSFLLISDTFSDSVTGWKLIFLNVSAYLAKTWEEVTSYMSSKFYSFIEGTLAGFRAILQAASANAQALGLTTETIDAGTRALQRAELGVLRKRKASEEASKSAVKDIETERKAREKALLSEVTDRDVARKAVASAYDDRIKDQQDILDKLAVQQAEADAVSGAKGAITTDGDGAAANAAIPETAGGGEADKALQLAKELMKVYEGLEKAADGLRGGDAAQQSTAAALDAQAMAIKLSASAEFDRAVSLAAAPKTPTSEAVAPSAAAPKEPTSEAVAPSAVAEQAGGSGAAALVAATAAGGPDPIMAERQRRIDLRSTTTILLDGHEVGKNTANQNVLSQDSQGGGHP